MPLDGFDFAKFTLPLEALIAHLAALWRGDLPLGQAFWEYAIAYGTIANVVATGATIAAVTVGLPDIIAMCLFLSPLPYVLTAVVGVVRSANKNEETPEWGTIAKIAVVVRAHLWFSSSAIGSPNLF